MTCNKYDMVVGGKYNWRYQAERLVYLGRNWSGNGYWHQFAKVDNPTVVWSEVTDSDLKMIEETLETCPTCDAKVVVVPVSDSDMLIGGKGFRSECSLHCPDPTFTRETKQEALNSWNIRVKQHKSGGLSCLRAK